MQERLSMRKIKDVLRLKYECGLSHEQIAASHHIAQSSVSKYVALAQAAGLTWPLPPDLTEQALEAKLFPRAGATLFRPTHKPPPDFALIHDELRTHKRLNLTLSLLWTEYQEQYPDGYQYSQFCRLYHAWRLQRDPPMRQTHKAGEKLFVDYSDGLFITNPNTGDRVATDWARPGPFLTGPRIRCTVATCFPRHHAGPAVALRPPAGPPRSCS